MRKFRMQCWDCKFYHVMWGCPICERYGELNDEETKVKCKGFNLKEKE